MEMKKELTNNENKNAANRNKICIHKNSYTQTADSKESNQNEKGSKYVRGN